MLNELDIKKLLSEPNPVWIYDVDLFKIHWANTQAIHFWESPSLDELINRDFRSNMSDAIFELLKSNLKEYEQGRDHTQWWTLEPCGKEKEVFCHLSGVCLDDGRTAMVVQVISSKEMLDSELSQIPSTIIASLWGSQGNLKSSNPLFKEIYGTQIQHFSDLFYSEEEACRLWQRALKEREYEVDITLPTPSGEQSHYIQMRVNQSKEGNIVVLRQSINTETASPAALLDMINPHVSRMSYRHQQMRQLIRKAMAKGEFVVEYQSIKQAPDHQLYAVEAVLKWDSCELGVILPDEFMPIADDSGISTLLGHYALEKACEQMMLWGGNNKPLSRLMMTLTPSQIMTPNYVEAIKQLLSRTQFPPEYLIIHVKGSDVAHKAPLLIKVFKELRYLGVMLASDGADGKNSVLNDVKSLPLTHMKFDHPAIDESEGHSPEFIKQIIHQAHQSGLQIIASNVNHALQLQLLMVLGCGLYQGALSGAPAR